jgi:hypothetical protein
VAYREEIGEIPHLADFTYHKTLPDIDFDAIPVPGLDADFYRRPIGDRLLSVGVYRFGGAETHRAWGWVGEAHCSWHAYRNPAIDGFDGPFRGCPDFRLLFEHDRLSGFVLGSGGLARHFRLDPRLLLAGHPAGVHDRSDRDRKAEEQPAAGEQRRGLR